MSGSVFEACLTMDVDGACEFYDCREPVARKTHTCYECGHPISKGERYERVSAKWDGDISTVKTCLACASVRDSLFSAFIHGHLWGYIHEAICLDGPADERFCICPDSAAHRE